MMLERDKELTALSAAVAAARAGHGAFVSGLSNRQTAQHLFITPATVETHLRHAFRKLGIGARGDLKAQLAG